VTKRLGGFPIETLCWTLAKKRKIVQPQNKKKKKRLANGGRGWEEEDVVITGGDFVFFLLFRDSFLLFLINRFKKKWRGNVIKV
jgi:hypothetical protein